MKGIYTEITYSKIIWVSIRKDRMRQSDARAYVQNNNVTVTNTEGAGVCHCFTKWQILLDNTPYKTKQDLETSLFILCLHVTF